MNGAFQSPAFADRGRETEAGRFGIIVFIAAEAMMFGAVLAVYWILRLHYGEPFAAASAELSRSLGSINTAILLTSSLAVAYAVEAGEPPRLPRPRLALLIAASLGAVFLGIKGYEWFDEAQKGLLPILSGPFRYEGPDPEHAALFFDLYLALTGLHALHLISGIGLVIWVCLRWVRVDEATRRSHLGVVGLYWHFVDMVWVFLFPLLYLVT